MITAADLAERLRSTVQAEAGQLRSISEAEASLRASGGDGWSRKHELGHLLDSATNNRVRFVVAGLTGAYDGPTYDADGWVKLGGYADWRWTELVDFWQTSNGLLAACIERIPESRLAAQCRVGSTPPVTLGFLIGDYILHMQHHLDHVLNRDQMTVYPGAAIGV